MATGRLPDPNSAPVTAKGDLYTYSTVPAKLTVGNNGDTLLADSSTSTGLRWQASPTIAQPVINGGMDLWQRGTSIAGGASVLYTADRWQMAANTASTVSRQGTGDTINLPFIQYCARVQRTNGSTSTTRQTIVTSIESANSIPFAGKTITLSFYARAGANYSATSSALGTGFYTGTGTDQNIFSGFTGQASSFGSFTLTTTWQRFTQTISMGATKTQLAIQFYYDPPAGTAGANDYFEVTGVQIDVGSTALPFRRSGGTLQGELAACQRYYTRITPVALGRIGSGNCSSTTIAEIVLGFPVAMRIAPTALEQSGTAGDYSVRSGGTNTTCSAVPIFSDATSFTATVNLTVTSGLTAGNAAIFRPVNTSAYLAWSAEL